MSIASGQVDSGKVPRRGAPRNSPVASVLVLAVLIVVAALTYKTLQHLPSPLSARPFQSGITDATPGANPGVQSANDEAAIDQNAAAAPATPPFPDVSQSDSAIESKEFLAIIAGVDGKKPVTAGQAQQWKESLRQLVSLGADAVPAIQQFLAQNLDANYAGVSGAGQLGYTSLRGALLNALGQIGLPEATAAMLETLQTSIYPTDMATISKLLETQAPGKYQQEILASVRRQLSLAAAGQLGGADVGPLFEVMAESGARGESVADDLAAYAARWPYYSVIALAGLPGNAGVPLLTQMAQGTMAGNQAVAAQALAELAPQNAEASNTLFGLAAAGRLDDSTLAQVAPFLGGRQYKLSRPFNAAPGGYLSYHVTSGNQDFSTHDGGSDLSGMQLLQRISIIDNLSAAVPPGDTAAQDAFQQQKTALAARLPIR